MERTAGRIAAAMVVVCTSTAAVGDAAAFNEHAIYCENNVDRRPKFVGTEWNDLHQSGATLKTMFDRGFDQWRAQTRSWDGSRLFTETNDYEVEFDAFYAYNGADAVTTCQTGIPGNRMRVDPDEAGKFAGMSSSRIQGFAAHEWGHAAGLGHSGWRDSWSGSWQTNPPTMSTCQWDWGPAIANPMYDGMNILSQDEHAAAAYLSNVDDDGFHPVTANESFERGSLFWKTHNGGSFYASTSADLWGSWGVSLNNTGGGFMYSNTRVYDQRKHFSHGTAAWDQLKGRSAVRKASSSDNGFVVVQAYYRPIVYLDGTRDDCNFFGDNLNWVDYIGSWQTPAQAVCAPESSFKPCNTNTLTIRPSDVPGDYGTNDNPDAVDVQIRIVSWMTRSGNPTNVHVDRLRVEYKF